MLDEFKEEIKKYVKEIFTLILEDYKEYLPKEKIDIINNFDYENDILIDSGGEYSTNIGRLEHNRLALSPKLFYETEYKQAMIKKLPVLNIKKIENKLKDSANNTFTEAELTSYIKANNLSCLDVVRGIIIHEVFHFFITMKDMKDTYTLEYNKKKYKCKGVVGEYLEEGLVEYYARKFASKHNLFLIPSIPYEDNIEYVKQLEKEFGNNIYKVLFKCNYKTLLNYVHKTELMTKYHELEYNWLYPRIIKRINNKEKLSGIIDIPPIEELKLI